MRLSSKKAAYVVVLESSVVGNPEYARDDKGWGGASIRNWLVAERVAGRSPTEDMPISTIFKALVGLRPSFRPRYALANLGHPSSSDANGIFVPPYGLKNRSTSSASCWLSEARTRMWRTTVPEMRGEKPSGALWQREQFCRKMRSPSSSCCGGAWATAGFLSAGVAGG
jgi:hypothetical protein